MKIRLIYRTEGTRIERAFATIDTARRWMYARLGPVLEACEPFGFVTNGCDTVVPLGCTVRQLLGRKGKRNGS